jgi:hypothetical protein
MTSEKTMYWMAVAVLGLGAVNGFVTRMGESAPQFVNRSVAMVAQASQTARDLTQMAGLTLRGDSQDFDIPQMAQMAQVRAQTRVACIQAIRARNQAAMARMQAERVRVRVLEHGPGSITWPGGDIVVEVPQVPRIEQDDTF